MQNQIFYPGKAMRIAAIALLLFLVHAEHGFGQTNTFPANGNAGVGTVNPEFKVTVVGDIGSRNPENQTAKVWIGWHNNVARIRLTGDGYGLGNGLDIQRNNDESLMRILANGNVGIGTAAPQAKLAVNGNILAKEVKVKTDITVPDYVFEEGYELPDLKELEAYVKQNKHLPEVPSAAEIERDGLDLAAMNLLLLKKVEELTLLLIKKDKKNNDMEGELREIKATLSEMKLERNKEQTR